MIDRTTFDRQIAILAEMHRYDLSAPTIDEYYRLLSAHLTTAQFVAACDALALDRSGFWPKPGAFLEAAGMRATSRAALQDEGVREFAAVRRWLSEAGGPRFIQFADYEALPAPTRAAIQAAGGLRELHETPESRLPKIEREFAAHYAEAKASGSVQMPVYAPPKRLAPGQLRLAK